MNKVYQKTASRRNGKLAALLLFVAMLLVLGAAYGRYQLNKDYSLAMEYKDNGKQIYALSAKRDDAGNLFSDENGDYLLQKGWTLKETGETKSHWAEILLANTKSGSEVCTFTQETPLQMFGTAGIGSSKALEIVLTIGNDSYKARATKVEKGTLLYENLGPGFMYRFYDNHGEELCLQLEGNQFSGHNITIAVTGSVAQTGALYLFAPYDVDETPIWCGQLDKEVLNGELQETITENVQSGEEDVKIAGTLSYCPTQYAKDLPIWVTAGEEGAVIQLGEGDFPTKTKYTVNGVTTVLSNGGKIVLKSGEIATVDLSQTEISDTIVFNTGGGTYTLEYAQLPKLAVTDIPLLMTEDTVTIPAKYMWGDLEPEITVQELQVDENGVLSFVGNNLFVWQKAADENIQIDSLGANAGTYLITVDWQDSEQILYSLETTVFLQRDLLD